MSKTVRAQATVAVWWIDCGSCGESFTDNSGSLMISAGAAQTAQRSLDCPACGARNVLPSKVRNGGSK